MAEQRTLPPGLWPAGWRSDAERVGAHDVLASLPGGARLRGAGAEIRLTPPPLWRECSDGEFDPDGAG